MANKNAGKKKERPKWYLDYFNGGLDSSERLVAIVELSRRGISVLRAMPDVHKALATPQQPLDRKKLEEVSRDANLAQSELDKECSTLSTFGTLALWSWFESFMLDFVALWIEKRPKTIAEGYTARVRIDLVELSRLNVRDRARLIVDELDKTTSGESRLGAGRFEKLLEPIGFNVTLDAEFKKTFLEFQQVRNCIAHRFGVVDQKLAHRCPWLKVRVGDDLALTLDQFTAYSIAVQEYILELIHEANAKFGVDSRSQTKKAGHRERMIKARQQDAPASS